MRLLLPAILLATTGGPVLGQEETLSREAAAALVRRMDEAFNARDLDALLACFDWENVQLMQVLASRMAPVLDGPVPLHRSSEIESFMPVDRRWVALVKSTTRQADTTDFPALEEYSYLVMKPRGREAIGAFTVEVDFDHLESTAENKFRCPACNYEVMGAPGWLAVPHRPERTQCMEAISFYYLGADLSLDVSVFVDPEPLEAMGAMRLYLASLFEKSGTSGDVNILAWTPPTYGDDPPPGLDGSSAELELPGLQVARHYLATLGSVRYLMVLSGNAGALAAHSQEADAILNSFRILDPTRPVEELSVMPIQAHTGSRLDGATFTNATYRITLEGPAGWTPSVYAAGYLFEVAYRCPLGRGAVWVTAHRPQAGLTAWYTRVADSWIRNHLQEQGMVIREESGWSEPQGEFRYRDLETTAPRNSVGVATLPRMIRLAMSDDLLLVLHGYGQDETDRDLVLASFDSLRRTPR